VRLRTHSAADTTGSRRRFLSRIGFVLGGLIFLQQLWSGYRAIGESVAFGSLLPIAAAAYCLTVITGALPIVAWFRLMAAIGAPLSWRHAIRGYTLAFLPRYIPGSIWGYLSRGEWFRENSGISYTVSNAGSLVETLAILTSNALIAGIYFAWVSADALRAILVATVLVVPPFMWWCVHEASVWSRASGFMSARLKGLLPQGIGLADWTMLVVTYVVLWLGYGGVVLLLVQAVGMLQPIDFISAAFSFSTSWLAGFAFIFTPAGLGIRELALSSQAAARMSLTVGQASALAVLVRFLMLMSELTWVLVGMALRASGQGRTTGTHNSDD
jgi:hypothetical protein